MTPVDIDPDRRGVIPGLGEDDQAGLGGVPPDGAAVQEVMGAALTGRS